jgi:hypothetical protein
MLDFPASSQSSTWIKKLTRQEPVCYRTKLILSAIVFIPVPNGNHGCRNTDAGVSFLDTDVQLWSYIYFVTHLLPLSSFPLSLYSSQTFILGSPHLFSLLLRCVRIHPRHISCDVHVSNVPLKNSRSKTNQKMNQENNLQDWATQEFH